MDRKNTHRTLRRFMGQSWYLNHSSTVEEFIEPYTKVMESASYFSSREVPEEYWVEPLKWLVRTDLKDLYGEHEAALSAVEHLTRVITERYVEERR